MAFETNSYSSQDDLISKLCTFATGDGWTQDALNTGTNVAALHKTTGDDDVYVQFSWDGTSIGVFQSLGYDGSAPGSNPNDSGSGGLGSNDRKVNAIGNGGGTYWFLSEWSGGQPHIYVWIEYATLTFRHFGFGVLDKSNDYTGGAFCYAHHWNSGASDIDSPLSSNHAVLLDAVGSSADRNATIHVESFPNQTASGKWGVVGGHVSVAAAGLDAASVARNPILGSARGGPGVSALAFTKASMLQGFIANVPMHLFYRNVTVTPERRYLMGSVPDMRITQMGSLEPLETFAVGTDTWMVVPLTRKRFEQDNTEESWNLGVLYRVDSP